MSKPNTISSAAARKRFFQRLKYHLKLYLIYCLVGLLLPPLFQKKAGAGMPPVPVQGQQERVRCIDDNEEALLWRLRMIASAQEEIILATFDWRDEPSGQDIMAALQGAADRGVQVRILVDGVAGTLRLRGNGHFRALAAMPNVEVRFYNPISLHKPWTWNYRMHDKYLIIDDTAYLLGGRNTYDLFLGSYVDVYNLDRDILVYTERAGGGASLSQLQAYFMETWSQSGNRTLQVRASHRAARNQQWLREREASLRERCKTACRPFDWESETAAANQVYLLSNPAGPQNKEPQLWNDLVGLMAQGTDIRIQTPYIICNQAMYDGLAEICTAAGTVQIMTNAVEIGANPFGCTDYLNQKDRILASGAQVVEWMGGQSLHTKTILIDDSHCIVGSFNLDMRSVYLDTELMLVIDCPELNRQMREEFDAMAQQSKTVFPDGTALYGPACEPIQLPFLKKCFYAIFRVVLWPIRYLL